MSEEIKTTDTAGSSIPVEETFEETDVSAIDNPISPEDESKAAEEYAASEEVGKAEIEEERGEDIDETEGVEIDATTQKVIEYEIVTVTEGKRIRQKIKKVVEKTEAEIAQEEQAIEEKTIAERIKALKFKVATGKATSAEKEELKLLTL